LQLELGPRERWRLKGERRQEKISLTPFLKPASKNKPDPFLGAEQRTREGKVKTRREAKPIGRTG
jgi:hypothetical protein